MAAELSRADSRSSIHSPWVRTLAVDEVLPLSCLIGVSSCAGSCVPATRGPHRSSEKTEAPDLLRATELDQIACASYLLLLLTTSPPQL